VLDPTDAEDFGPYRVYEPLGMGGVAMVHRAEIRALGKPIALKRVLPHLRTNPEIVDAFIHEARLASYLQHPNIAQTFELGKIDDTFFIAMELVPGPTLDQIMRHSQAVAGAIPVPVTLGILVQICEALHYAHGLCDPSGRPLGIIHRDVSPPNVIVSNTGAVKLVDFGIAKVQGDPRTTGAGVIKGKTNYIAPEYLGGRIDARADLFALGVIAHELLVGRRLFEGENDFETSARVLEMSIQPPSRFALSIPPELDDVVMYALQRDPARRWQTAAQLRDALVAASGPAGVADQSAILAWVEWAFRKKARRSDFVTDVLATLDQPTTGERVLTAEQHEELEQVALTSSQASLTSSQANRPLIVAARPIPQRRGRKLGTMTPAVGEPVPDDETSAEASSWGRVIVTILLVLLAAAGGVFAAWHLVGT
jgi:serine/threonine protein kinase